MCTNNKDFCGPKVTGWRTWFISLLVPDNLWGVYIGNLCKIHDAAYTVGGSEEDRAKADIEFSEGIELKILNKLLVIGGGPKVLAQVKRKAYLGSRIYWLGVHYGGSKQFNYKE